MAENLVKLNATAVIVAAVGIFIQFVVGVPGYPDVPPGPIILGGVGIAVFALGARWRWVIIVGLIVPLFITVGGILEGSSWGRLGRPGDVGPFLGTAIQWTGLVVAVVAGVLAIGQAFRSRAAS